MASQHTGTKTVASVESGGEYFTYLSHYPLAKTPMHDAAPMPSAPEYVTFGDALGRDDYNTSICTLGVSRTPSTGKWEFHVPIS